MWWDGAWHPLPPPVEPPGAGPGELDPLAPVADHPVPAEAGSSGPFWVQATLRDGQFGVQFAAATETISLRRLP